MDLRLRSLFSAATSLSVILFFTLLVACGSSSSPSTSTNGGTGSNTGSTGSSNSGSGGSGSGGTAGTAAIAFVTDGADGSYQWGGSSFSGVKVDSTGAASASAAATSMSTSIASLVIPSKDLLFVSTETPQANGTINGYSFDANGGSLKQVSSTPTADTTFIASDANGTTLYAAGYSSGDPASGGQTFAALYGWSINPSSGSLTPLPGSPYVTTYDNGIGQIAVSPDGAWVCADVTIGEATSYLVCFQRNSDGTLNVSKSIQPIGGLQAIEQTAFSPDSKWVFVAGGPDNAIDEGSMTNPTSTSSVPTGGLYSNGVAVDPSGKWIVASNFSSNNLAVFSIAGDGTLSAGPLASTPGKPSQLAFSKSGKSLFVATDAGTAVYSFDPSSGALKPASGSPVSGGGGGPIVAW